MKACNAAGKDCGGITKAAVRKYPWEIRKGSFPLGDTGETEETSYVKCKGFSGISYFCNISQSLSVFTCYDIIYVTIYRPLK